MYLESVYIRNEELVVGVTRRVDSLGAVYIKVESYRQALTAESLSE